MCSNAPPQDLKTVGKFGSMAKSAVFERAWKCLSLACVCVCVCVRVLRLSICPSACLSDCLSAGLGMQLATTLIDDGVEVVKVCFSGRVPVPVLPVLDVSVHPRAFEPRKTAGETNSG